MVNDFRGERESFIGDNLFGDLVIGKPFCGDTKAIGLLWTRTSSTGAKDTRLLSRRVDLRLICFASAVWATSSASAEASSAVGTSYSVKGCRSATIRVAWVRGSIGRRLLCLFLGTHLSSSSAKVGTFDLVLDATISSEVISASFALDTDSMVVSANLPRGAPLRARCSLYVPLASAKSHLPSCVSVFPIFSSHDAAPQAGTKPAARARFLLPCP